MQEREISFDSEKKLVYGFHPIFEALRSGTRSVKKILISSGRRDKRIKELISLAKERRVPYTSLRAEVFNKKYPIKAVQGVVAELEDQHFVMFEDILALPKKRKEAPFFLILDEVEDPRNFGAILRTAEAGGVHGVLFPSHRSAGFGPSLYKSSAGACEYLPLCRVLNIKHYMERFKEAGISIIGTLTHEAPPYWTMDFIQPLAFVLGSEEKGLRSSVKQRCDYLTAIPMVGQISSLNVSVAAGILIYETMRQRQLFAGSGLQPEPKA